MAITTYGELKTALSTQYLLHTRWVAAYDNATQLFEAATNRRLRVRQMETSTNLTTVFGDVALPTDYLVWRSVLWTGRDPPMPLDYTHPEYLESFTGSVPQLFTIEGSTFKVRPVSDTDDYEFHYYQKIPTITDSNAGTNWLLAANEDVYLFGVLTELSALQRNIEMAQLYKARRDEVFAEIIQLSALTTGATSPMVRTAEYF